MSETKNSTTKTIFVFVIIVAVVAGIYVLKMNEVNNLLGIGAATSTAAMAPATKSAADSNLVPGGNQSTAAAPETPAAAPASTGESNPPTAPAAQASSATTAPAPAQTPTAATAAAPVQTPPATSAQTPPANKKVHGKKAAG